MVVLYTLEPPHAMHVMDCENDPGRPKGELQTGQPASKEGRAWEAF